MTMNNSKPKLAFIGAGNMTSSLVHGLIDSGYDASQIYVADRHADKSHALEKQFSVHAVSNNAQAAAEADIIVLAVKPKDIKIVAEEIKSILQQRKSLIISIAAGITTHYLHALLGANCNIVRAMPNTGALLKSGATGLYADGKVSEDQRSLAESILRAVGVVVWLNHEHDMDTVTALSGSGPAYFFLIMDALQQGAIQLGLSQDIAKILTLQTALGAAKMAMESEISLEALIQRVASKGGTTEAALEVLEQGKIRELMKETLQAAQKRAQELSEGFKNDSL